MSCSESETLAIFEKNFISGPQARINIPTGEYCSI